MTNARLHALAIWRELLDLEGRFGPAAIRPLHIKLAVALAAYEEENRLFRGSVLPEGGTNKPGA